MTSVSYLMLAAGGMGSGLGVLLFVPVVGVALYGKRWESAVGVGFLLGALLAVTVATSPAALDTTALVRRLFLTGAITALLSVAIHVLRGRLVESNTRSGPVAPVRRRRSTPPSASWSSCRSRRRSPRWAPSSPWASPAPAGSEILRASYFRIEDGMVVIDAQLDDAGTHVQGTLAAGGAPRPARGGGHARAGGRRPSTPTTAGPKLRAVLDATGITHGAWVPVCPDGKLHGVLGHRQPGHVHPEGVRRPLRRPGPLPRARALQLGRPPHARGAGDRRRSAGASPASCTTGWPTSWPSSPARPAAPRRAPRRRPTPASWPVRADRALDEARRAITVLSVSQPQSLDAAISQTVEDLGSRLGVAWDLQLADDVEVPGEVHREPAPHRPRGHHQRRQPRCVGARPGQPRARRAAPARD